TLDLSGHSVPGFPTLTNMTASSVTNGGQIILATTPSVAGNTLTVGTYNGTGGSIVLNTFLGGDGSPSDRLILNGGTATGTTSLTIHNANGPGSETTGNGILVVDAINGGTTGPGTFTLANEARAGAYDYFLFRGSPNGIDPAVANDWFLRSTFMVGPG